MPENLTRDIVTWAQTIPERLLLLGLAGVCGALLRAVTNPEQKIVRRLGQLAAGIASAVFLGGVVADIMSAVIDFEEYSTPFMAAGFVLGWGGIQAISAVQDKILSGSKGAGK